ncbi:MAG: NADPH:quinone oxidoreductase family protein, partial [Betaproteobacteria bacterium]|nr:NADPH:quinone oxidoreductase family protein [Betaproteobacteria bacterium]
MPANRIVDHINALASGQIRVDVHAAGVNFPDSLIIRNLYQFKPELPFSPGGEIAGVISALGEGVEGLRVGDAVMALCGHGGFAQQALVEAAKAVRIPAGVAMDMAASFTMVYATSYHGLADRAQLKAGESLLVLGAAGGVGLAAVEIGKALGARVIAAASSDEKLEVCRAQDLSVGLDSLAYPHGPGIDRGPARARP